MFVNLHITQLFNIQRSGWKQNQMRSFGLVHDFCQAPEDLKYTKRNLRKKMSDIPLSAVLLVDAGSVQLEVWRLSQAQRAEALLWTPESVSGVFLKLFGWAYLH